MFVFAVILFAAVTGVYGQTTAVTQCTSNAGALPINLYVEGCETPPCQLPQLQDAVMNAVFHVPHYVTSMTTSATAYLSIGPITVPIPYPLGQDSVTCNFLTNTYCPIVPGEIVQYRFAMFIESAFPVGTNADLELSVSDQNSTQLFCFRISIAILPPVGSRIADEDQVAGKVFDASL